MNLVLLKKSKINSDLKAIIDCPTTVDHIAGTLGKSSGEEIQVGLIDGLQGTAQIEKLESKKIYLENIQANQPSPQPIPIRLVMAIQRPKMLKRMLRTASMMGIKDIHILHCFKVEKSYWNSDLFKKNGWQQYLEQGLAQAKDTNMPTLTEHRRFKPFVEDTVSAWAQQNPVIVAHPYAEEKMPPVFTGASTVIIGPEGGFLDYELNLLAKCGAMPRSLGPRILRSEDMIATLVTRHSEF